MPSYPPAARTTDATPTSLSTGTTVPEDSVCRVPLFCFASDHGGNVGYWEWRVTARRVGNAAPTIIFAAPVPAQKTAGAVSWLAQPVVGGSAMDVQFQGGIGQTVDWLITSEEPFCMVGEFA